MTRFETITVHGARAPAIANRSAAPPIFQSAAYVFDSLGQAEAVFSGKLVGAQYGTRGAPNVAALETGLRELEGADDVVVTSGGCSALLCTMLAHLRPDATILTSHDLFGGTSVLLDLLSQWRIHVQFVDGCDLREVTRALEQHSAMVLVETISNPRMRVPDIAAIAKAAHDVGALVVVDNTLASPFHCTPLALGADLVVESLSKSLSGHFDVVMGAVAGRKELTSSVRDFAVRGGMVPGGFEAWLCARGLSSFAVRQERASATAADLAAWLGNQNGIRAVHYPGLPCHDDHDVSTRVLRRGHGSMMAFELDTSDTATIEVFVQELRVVKLVHSLGGPSTTLSHPLTMTHRNSSPDTKRRLALTAGFFRLSVGLEHADDIRIDLERGLKALCK